MAPKSLLTVEHGAPPPPFVVRKADDDFSGLHSHQQRIMHQPFLALNTPGNVAEARAAALQELVNGTSAPLSVTSKMTPAIVLQNMFDGVDVRSFVRVRPVLASDKPLKPGDQTPVQRVAGKKEAVMFMPRMNANGTLLDAYAVSVDGCFSGSNADTDSVYESVAPPLVQVALFGGCSSVICYGQTGSGKTHTAFGFLRNIAKDLEPVMETHRVLLTVLELQQATIVDMLSGEVTQIMETEQGLTFSGAEEPEMSCIAMLYKLIDVVESQRTKHHKASIKTHLFVRISLRSKRTAWTKPGSFIVVDLAGSEKADDPDMRYIGAAFTALKDCIRIRAIQKANQTANEGSVPLRTTNLTFVLKEVLEVTSRATKLAIVHCVSPSYANLKHSFETLRMATLCNVHPYSEQPSQPMLLQFSFQDCCDFLTKLSFGRIRQVQSVLPENFDGKRMLAMTEDAFVLMLGERAPPGLGVPARVARSIFLAMQAIAIATKSLGPSTRAPVMGFGGPKRPPALKEGQSGKRSSVDASTPSPQPPAPSTAAASPKTASQLPSTDSARTSTKSTSNVVPLPSLGRNAQPSPRTVPPK